MSSNPLERIRRSFSLRLTLWYAAVTLMAFAVLFALAYRSLTVSLEDEDRKVLLSKYRQYADRYGQGDLSDLEEAVDSERDFGKPFPYFVRMASSDNRSLFLSLPDAWSDADLAQTEGLSLREKYQRLQIAGRGGETVFEFVSMPLEDGNVLQVGKAIGLREELQTRFHQVFVGVMIPAVLIGLIGGYFLTYRALRPVRDLAKTVQSVVDTGDMESRVPPGRTHSEMNDLVILFNRMLDRIGNLVDGMKESLDVVAHDLKTPMTRLRGTAEMALQPGQSQDECRDALVVCLEESERIVKMLDTIMDIAEAETGTLTLDIERLDLAVLVEEVVDLYRYVAEERNTRIAADLSRGLHVSVDPRRMRQAVANILDNAVKYTPVGGRVDVDAHRQERQVVLTVRDTGIGIRREDLPRIWDRLYRGEEGRSQRGLGLGLCVVKSIVEIHGGHVEVASEPGAGSTFSIRLPGAD